jgi:hypothetical protein
MPPGGEDRVASVVTYSAAFLSLAVLCNGGHALARNPHDVFNQPAGIPQSVVTKAVQAEWRRSPDVEVTCVDQNPQPRGIEHMDVDRAKHSSF